jgi:hypothetical protein
VPSITVFRPPNSIGSLIGGAVVLFCYVLVALLAYRGIKTDVSLTQLGPFVGAGFFFAMGSLFLYWSWGCRTLLYTVDRNSLTIRWGGLRQVVPLESIERLVPGDESDATQLEGVSWPGHHVGRGTVEAIGDVIFYSAHRTMKDILYVQTPDQIYGISVPDQIAFAHAIQSNQSRGPLFDQRQAVYRWGLASQSFWLDAHARLLTAALIASFVAVLAYVLNEYPGLPQSVALRFPSLGGIVRVADKSELLDIPRSGAIFMALNLGLAIVLHSWERMVGYVLLIAGVCIQVMLLVAAIVAVA